MPDRSELAAVVHEWTIKAENDLKNASHTLNWGKSVPPTRCAFTHNSVWKCI